MNESSDNTNQPRKLEEVFRDGFEPAEVAPSNNLWSRIEQDLDRREVSYYKRHLGWYRSVAAASVLLLMLAMGYFWYDTQTVHQVALPDMHGTTAQRNQPNQPGRPSANIPSAEIESTYSKEKPASNNGANLLDSDMLAESGSEKLSNPNNYNRSSQGLASSQEKATTFRNRVGLTPVRKQLPDLPGKNKLAQLNDNNSEPTNSEISSLPLTPAKDTSSVLENTVAFEPLKSTRDNRVLSDTTKQLAHAGSPTRSRTETDSLAGFTASLTSEKSNKANGSRWAIGGGTGSQYFQQNIEFADGTSGNLAYSQQNGFYNSIALLNRSSSGNSIEDAKKEFNENTQSAFSYRAAMAVNYRINHKWSLESGLTFIENQAQTNTSYIIYKRPSSLYNTPAVKQNNAGFADQFYGVPSTPTVPMTIFLAQLTDGNLDNSNVTIDKVDPFNMYYRYRQVGIPVRLRYQQNHGKWFNYIQMGGAVNILLKTSILSDSPRIPEVEYTIGQPSPFRQWYLTALGSIGRGLLISDVWQVQGGLDVARNFSSLAQEPSLLGTDKDKKSYYLGFGLSTSYILGKKSIK